MCGTVPTAIRNSREKLSLCSLAGNGGCRGRDRIDPLVPRGEISGRVEVAGSGQRRETHPNSVQQRTVPEQTTISKYICSEVSLHSQLINHNN